ncbi:MAG: NrpR regulatory domain-containing protein [Archaeoglobaceae archaeon]
MVEEEILEILNEFGPLSSQEIEKELQGRGFEIKSRTVRYHLKKLEINGFVSKNDQGRSQITAKGIEFLRGLKTFERLGEFTERIELNVYSCDFDILRMKGKVPTNIAYIKKDNFEKCVRILEEMENFPFLIHRGVFIADEGEDLNGKIVPQGSFAIVTISNTIYDVLLRSVGVNTYPEFSALVGVEKMVPKRILELISYAGTTMSPGWLLLRSGLTSVSSILRTGDGVIISAVRSFSRYAIDIVVRNVELASSKGFGGVLAILHPSDKRFSLPTGKRARLFVSAGLNHLAPIHEIGVEMDVRVNEVLLEFSRFKPISNIK